MAQRKRPSAPRVAADPSAAPVPLTFTKATWDEDVQPQPLEATQALATEYAETAEAAAAPVIDFVEAATSPAISSDVNPVAAPSAQQSQGSADMATTYTPADTAEKTQALLGEVQNRMKTGFERSTKMGEDMVEFAKGNVEAMMASARVAAKAGETIGQDAADYSRKSFESATAAFKSFATVKSPTELFQLQSEFAKASFDSAVAEASKLSETMIKLAGEIAQPLSNRYALAAEKLKANVA